jgi:rRNA processing protein Gar1
MGEDAKEVEDLVLGLVKKLEYMQESQAIKSRNEIIYGFASLSLKSDLEQVACEILPLGTVLHFTEGFLMIAPSPTAPLLELDTKVCTEDFIVIGHIDDIIGSVEKPNYAVIAYKSLLPGTVVYYPANSHILASVSRKKGTDASNYNDEETSEESSEEEVVKDEESGRKRKVGFKIFEQPPPFE